MKTLLSHLLIVVFFAQLFSNQITVAQPHTAAGSQAARAQLEHARHVLNRLTYGARPGEIELVAHMGVATFIDKQLHPEILKMPPSLVEIAESKPALTLTPARLFMQYGKPAQMALARQSNPGIDEKDVKKDAQKLIRETYKAVYHDVAEVHLQRALWSPRQLEELMSEFWFNHFNISMDKGLDHILVGAYEETAIRPYAMGKFRDLLGATAHHAGMLFYLDNWQNSVPANDRPGGRKQRFRGLNENYARELMELHTLGVDGGYTQQDVIALARVLTGLGLQSRRGARITDGGIDNRFGDSFDSVRHDYSDKVLLGHRIKERGAGEIEEALDLLAAHPSTARHICYKLAQFFVSDKPPETLVAKLAGKFQSTDGNIRAVLSELFYSNDFWDPQYIGTKFKSPYRYLVSSLRASDSTFTSPVPLLAFLKQQGQPLYQCLTPDGYKNTQQAWLDSNALLNRINFATAVGFGRMPGVRTGTTNYADVASTQGGRFSSATTATLDAAPAQLKTSLLLGSPEFMMY